MNGLFCKVSCQEPLGNGREFDVKSNGMHVKVINNAHDGNLGILEVSFRKAFAMEDFLCCIECLGLESILGESKELAIEDKEYHRLAADLYCKIYQAEEGKDAVYCAQFVASKYRSLYAVYNLIKEIYINRFLY